MKNVIVSAVIGIAVGFAVCYFLIDRGTPVADQSVVMDESTTTSSQTDAMRTINFSAASGDTTSGEGIKALKTSMTEVRGYTRDYHKPASAGGGGAPLTTNVRSEQCPLPNDVADGNRIPIKSFYLSKELVIDQLTEKFAKDKPQDDYRGFAGIFGYDSVNEKYNITWSLVYSEGDIDVPENSCGEMIYFLPDITNESDDTYLYEHVYLCPPNCRQNEDRFQ